MSINNFGNLSMLKKYVQIATAHTDKEVFIAEICFHIYYSILSFWGQGKPWLWYSHEIGNKIYTKQR